MIPRLRWRSVIRAAMLTGAQACALLTFIPDLLAEPMKDLTIYESDSLKAALNERIQVLKKSLSEAERQQQEVQGNEPRMRPRGKSQDLSPRIVNGVVTAGFPSVGALLLGIESGSSLFHCSGTLIGCSSFLTAAHCVEENSDPRQYKVYFQHAGIFDVEEILFQKDKYRYPQADIAVIKLKQPVSGIEASHINSQDSVLFGTPGTIVGFGRSGGLNHDYGIKQVGIVITRDCRHTSAKDISNDKFLCWEFNAPVGNPGENSNTCNGDSGGPLFAVLGTSQNTFVAGTTVTGKNRTCLTHDFSYDTSVLAHSGWVKDICKNDLLTPCGDLPFVGSDFVSVMAADGDLGLDRDQQSFEVDLPRGISTLRIAMNGQDDGRRNVDFDLSVRQGSAQSKDFEDCSRSGKGQFAFCEFTAPKPGIWHILVNRKNGQGKFQIVATMFRKPGP